MTFVMTSLVLVTGIVFLVVWLHHNSIPVLSQSSRGVPGREVSQTVFVNGTVSIATTDEDFICVTLDWWPPDKCDYGICSWGRSTILTLDLKNEILLNAVKCPDLAIHAVTVNQVKIFAFELSLISVLAAVSPLRIRMGGTLQDTDRVLYQSQDDQTPCNLFPKHGSEFLGFSRGCLSMSRWYELNSLFKDSRAVVTFGLNALYGRTVSSDGSVVGPWDSSNAESPLQYTVNRGYPAQGWELGNELTRSSVGARVSEDQYASDVNTLQNLVETDYAGFEDKPLILAPGGFFNAEWFGEFMEQSNGTLQVVTHHVYNLSPGVDEHLIDKILHPSYPDGARQNFMSLEAILKNSGTSAVAWVGEAGGAYNSGCNLVMNSFVFNFWQSLIGGNYGLLSTSTFQPNSNYYSALLWHRLMGSTVLNTSFSGTDKLRTYIHCSRNAIDEFISIDELFLQQQSQSSRTGFAKMSRKYFIHASTREEYHLTADGGDLHSQTMLLNGKILRVDSSGKILRLDPVKVRESDLISVAPYSIVFARFTNLNISACT